MLFFPKTDPTKAMSSEAAKARLKTFIEVGDPESVKALKKVSGQACAPLKVEGVRQYLIRLGEGDNGDSFVFLFVGDGERTVVVSAWTVMFQGKRYVLHARVFDVRNDLRRTVKGASSCRQ